MNRAIPLIALAPVVLLTGRARAQSCQPAWRPGFTSNQIGVVEDLAVFDDGAGPALYLAGDLAAATAPDIAGIARWTGSSFAPLRSPIQNPVYTIRAFNFGGGPALFAGGLFTSAGGAPAAHIARFDGFTWSALGAGTNDGVRSVAIFDDGSGPAIYAAGDFTTAGGSPAARIARWNGTSWSPLGAGMNSAVQALSVFDDGSGAALYAAGNFTTAGGVSANHIARWNGSAWAPVGVGLDNTVYALVPFSGALYAGGQFFEHISRWNGTAWSAAGSVRPAGSIYDLVVADDGSGPALFAGGRFSILNGGSTLYATAKWNGATWIFFPSGPNGTVYAIEGFNDGAGTRLFVGGLFTNVGVNSDAAPSFAIRDGSGWSAAPGTSVNGPIRALQTADDGSGPALYAGGTFTLAGQVRAFNIARWDGSAWSALGAGVNGTVYSLQLFSGGPGPALYVGGAYTEAGGSSASSIARWDGQAWTALGSGLTGNSPNYGFAMTVFDDGSGPALYAGGSFLFAGGAPAPYIARWNGTSWSAVGTGTDGLVTALAVYDEGSGPRLFAGGSFMTAGGRPARALARWNGSAWSAIDPVGVIGTVTSLVVHDDGTGPGLYAGGSFDGVGGVPNTRNIARWNGTAWAPLGLGIADNTFVRSMAVYDDGSGSALYAVGDFFQASATPTTHIAKWKDYIWTQVGGGLSPNNSSGYAASVFNDLSGSPRLYVGGSFDHAGATPSYCIAEWIGCPVCYANCDRSTSAPALNVLDFACFLNRYASGDPYANCDGSTVPPVINVIDFACFLNRFAAGCP